MSITCRYWQMPRGRNRPRPGLPRHSPPGQDDLPAGHHREMILALHLAALVSRVITAGVVATPRTARAARTGRTARCRRCSRGRSCPCAGTGRTSSRVIALTSTHRASGRSPPITPWCSRSMRCSMPQMLPLILEKSPRPSSFCSLKQNGQWSVDTGQVVGPQAPPHVLPVIPGAHWRGGDVFGALEPRGVQVVLGQVQVLRRAAREHRAPPRSRAS